MTEDIILRLEGLGFEVTERDHATIEFIKNKMEEYVKSECGGCVPEGIYYHIIDWVVAEFLVTLKASGERDFCVDFDSGALKSLTEGDVSASWETAGVKSNEERFEELIQKLNANKGIIASYRKLNF